MKASLLKLIFLFSFLKIVWNQKKTAVEGKITKQIIYVLTEADVRIAYGAGRAFNDLEEDEIENEEMNSDSSDDST